MKNIAEEFIKIFVTSIKSRFDHSMEARGSSQQAHGPERSRRAEKKQYLVKQMKLNCGAERHHYSMLIDVGRSTVGRLLDVRLSNQPRMA